MDTLRLLLQDTSLRLEGQAYLLRQLQLQLHLDKEKSIALAPDHDLIGKPHRKIIKASNVNLNALALSNSNNNNNLLNWKGHLEREQVKEKALLQAKTLLRNLNILHQDTFQITQQLLQSNHLWGTTTTNTSAFLPSSSSSSSSSSFSTGSVRSSCSTTTPQTISIVSSTLEQVRSRHATTLESMADLVWFLRPLHPDEPNKSLPTPILQLLHHFLQGRLAVQILCDHVVSLHQKRRKHGGRSSNNSNGTSVGAGGGGGSITVHGSLEPVIQEAWTEAKHLCEAHYQQSPEIDFPTYYPTKLLTFVRPWLHHVLVEMFKNSLVASMEVLRVTRDENENDFKSADMVDLNFADLKPPPIKVEIDLVRLDERDFVRILIHDSGGGFDGDPFRFASSLHRWDRLDVQQSYASVRSPLSSLGVGVPASQWLMQHFGGKLELINRESYSGRVGCTAIVTLPLDDTLPESLPMVPEASLCN